jgi:hypothetical protein
MKSGLEGQTTAQKQGEFMNCSIPFVYILAPSLEKLTFEMLNVLNCWGLAWGREEDPTAKEKTTK